MDQCDTCRYVRSGFNPDQCHCDVFNGRIICAQIQGQACSDTLYQHTHLTHLRIFDYYFACSSMLYLMFNVDKFKHKCWLTSFKSEKI